MRRALTRVCKGIIHAYSYRHVPFPLPWAQAIRKTPSLRAGFPVPAGGEGGVPPQGGGVQNHLLRFKRFKHLKCLKRFKCLKRLERFNCLQRLKHFKYFKHFKHFKYSNHGYLNLVTCSGVGTRVAVPVQHPRARR